MRERDTAVAFDSVAVAGEAGESMCQGSVDFAAGVRRNQSAVAVTLGVINGEQRPESAGPDQPSSTMLKRQMYGREAWPCFDSDMLLSS